MRKLHIAHFPSDFTSKFFATSHVGGFELLSKALPCTVARACSQQRQAGACVKEQLRAKVSLLEVLRPEMTGRHAWEHQSVRSPDVQRLDSRPWCTMRAPGLGYWAVCSAKLQLLCIASGRSQTMRIEALH